MLNHIAEKMKGQIEMEAISYMQKYLQLKEGTFCMICEGYGHVANHCGTKKRIDAITKGTGMRQYWGAYKSNQKIDFMGDKADIAEELRAQEHKRNYDNNSLMAVARGNVIKESSAKVRAEGRGNAMKIEDVRPN